MNWFYWKVALSKTLFIVSPNQSIFLPHLVLYHSRFPLTSFVLLVSVVSYVLRRKIDSFLENYLCLIALIGEFFHMFTVIVFYLFSSSKMVLIKETFFHVYHISESLTYYFS